MAKTRGGLISSFRTVDNQQASGIFKPNFITALNRDGGFPQPHSFKINSNGTVTTFYPGNSGYVRHGGQWAHTVTVATTCTVTFYLWGAAGGSGSYGTGYHAGNGGLTYATTTLQAGTPYYIYVGEGGEGTTSGGSNGGLGGWPNGGRGSKGDASGAGGGGMTMLSKAVFATNMNDSDILMIAGGGGGTTGYAGHAGHGGGQEGTNSSLNTTHGQKGTQTSHGANNGGKLLGGDSGGNRTVNSSDDSGGGGGGYYGGGAGYGDGKPGGGGSGYYNTSLTTNQTYTASAAWSGNATVSSLVSPPDVNSLLANSDWAGNSDEKYAQGKISATSAQSRAHGLVYFSVAT